MNEWYEVKLNFIDGTNLTVKVQSPKQLDLLTRLSTKKAITFSQEDNKQFVVDLDKVKYSEVSPYKKQED